MHVKDNNNNNKSSILHFYVRTSITFSASYLSQSFRIYCNFNVTFEIHHLKFILNKFFISEDAADHVQNFLATRFKLFYFRRRLFLWIMNSLLKRSLGLESV